eukprot:9716540-Ditylum_brightwellii.AAC.1
MLYDQDEDVDSKNEVGLVYANDIICFQCGKKGHKGFQCPITGARQEIDMGRNASGAVKIITLQKILSKTPAMHIKCLNVGEKEAAEETPKRKETTAWRKKLAYTVSQLK